MNMSVGSFSFIVDRKNSFKEFNVKYASGIILTN